MRRSIARPPGCVRVCKCFSGLEFPPPIHPTDGRSLRCGQAVSCMSRPRKPWWNRAISPPIVWNGALPTGGYHGKVDGIGGTVADPLIIEIKTTDDRAVTKPDYPENYLWQLFLYCLGWPAERGLIFQIGRSQGLSRHRVFFLDDVWRKRLEQHIGEMGSRWAEYKVKGLVPACDHQRFGWQDKFCNYRDWKPASVGADDMRSVSSLRSGGER